MISNEKFHYKSHSHLELNLIDYLSENMKTVSKKKIKNIIDSGGVYINNKRIFMAKFKLKANDIITVFWSNEQETLKKLMYSLKPEQIIFENEDFLVVNKPSGIPSQASLDSVHNTIISALKKSFKNYESLDFHLVHRLDKDTSGLMILAKSKAVKKDFDELFKSQSIKKTYHSLCFFSPKENNGTISFPLAKDASRKNAYIVSNRENSKKALTHYKVLVYNRNLDASYVECKPKTGRTHQIRVHLSAVGAPLLGDKTYAQNVLSHSLKFKVLRHMLHASELDFSYKNKAYKLKAEYPVDFQISLEQIKSDS